MKFNSQNGNPLNCLAVHFLHFTIMPCVLPSLSLQRVEEAFAAYTNARGVCVRTLVVFYGTCTLVRHQYPGVLGACSCRHYGMYLAIFQSIYHVDGCHLTESWCHALCIKDLNKFTTLS